MGNESKKEQKEEVEGEREMGKLEVEKMTNDNDNSCHCFNGIFLVIHLVKINWQKLTPAPEPI